MDIKNFGEEIDETKKKLAELLAIAKKNDLIKYAAIGSQVAKDPWQNHPPEIIPPWAKNSQSRSP